MDISNSCEIYESKGFQMPEQTEPLDPMWRERSCGEYYMMVNHLPGHPLSVREGAQPPQTPPSIRRTLGIPHQTHSRNRWVGSPLCVIFYGLVDVRWECRLTGMAEG